MKNISALGDRFIEVMEQIGHTGYSFSRELETSEAVISNIRKGKNPPNIHLICRLLKKYEAIDPLWLLLGEGRMFRSQTPAISGGSPRDTPSVSVISQPLTDTLAERIEQRLEKIEGMLRRSVEGQIERAVLVDESIAELSDQVKSLGRSTEHSKMERRDTR